MDDKIDFSRLEKEIDLFKTNFDGLDIGSNQLIFVSSIVIPYLEQLIKLVRPNDFTKLQLKQLYDISKKFFNHINKCNTLFISNKSNNNLNFHLVINSELLDLTNLYDEYRSVLDSFLSLAIGASSIKRVPGSIFMTSSIMSSLVRRVTSRPVIGSCGTPIRANRSRK